MAAKINNGREIIEGTNQNKPTKVMQHTFVRAQTLAQIAGKKKEVVFTIDYM